MNEESLMYIHQVEFDVITKILEKVTNVNKVLIYNMPNKAEKYADNAVELISILNEFNNSDEEWRITIKENVNASFQNEVLKIDNWEISGSKKCICIPKINSIIIIPDESSTCEGLKDPSKIIQLINCVSISPLLITLYDEPIVGDTNKFNLSMGYNIIEPKKS